MTSDFPPIKLRIPHQDLDGPSLFAADESALGDWIAALPKANTGQSTRLLFQAISELNRTRLLPGKRLALLELLRPPIYLASRGLGKHYLSQPIVLPEQAAKVAKLAHTLHQQLADGYAIVAAHTAALGTRAGIARPTDVIAAALQRAITEHSLNVIRHYQLYEPVNDDTWHTLNQMLLLAQQQKAHKKEVADNEYGDISVEAAYLRIALIHCAKPNQLRQEDLMEIFQPMNRWTALTSLEEGVNENALFAIDPSGDNPPVYHTLVSSVINDSWLGINTERLIGHLQNLRVNAKGATRANDGDQSISIDLLGHLVLSWSTMSKRVFMRVEQDEALELTLGLSNTHHFVSGGMSFEALVMERGARTFTSQQGNPFLKVQGQVEETRLKDVWDSPYSGNIGQTQVSLDSIDYYIKKNEAKSDNQKNKYRSHHVRSINSSAHGYCIEWPKDLIAQVKAGEVIGIRESNRKNWSIGVIRWVSRDEKTFIQIGIELISPSASPYGAKVIQKVGESADYSRVLVLPEIPAIKRPFTLLTPRLPFREGQKVILNQRGKQIQIQLTKKLNDVGAYNQFEFRRNGNSPGRIKLDQQQAAGGADNFDSLWSSL